MYHPYTLSFLVQKHRYPESLTTDEYAVLSVLAVSETICNQMLFYKNAINLNLPVNTFHLNIFYFFSIYNLNIFIHRVTAAWDIFIKKIQH